MLAILSLSLPSHGGNHDSENLIRRESIYAGTPFTPESIVTLYSRSRFLFLLVSGRRRESRQIVGRLLETREERTTIFPLKLSSVHESFSGASAEGNLCQLLAVVASLFCRAF